MPGEQFMAFPVVMHFTEFLVVLLVVFRLALNKCQCEWREEETQQRGEITSRFIVAILN